MIFGEGTCDIAFLEQDIGCLAHTLCNFECNFGVVNVVFFVLRPILIRIATFAHWYRLRLQRRVVGLELATIDDHHRTLRYVSGGTLAVFDFSHDRFPLDYLTEDDVAVVKVRSWNCCNELWKHLKGSCTTRLRILTNCDPLVLAPYQ